MYITLTLSQPCSPLCTCLFQRRFSLNTFFNFPVFILIMQELDYRKLHFPAPLWWGFGLSFRFCQSDALYNTWNQGVRSIFFTSVGLAQWFLNASMHKSHLEVLLKQVARSHSQSSWCCWSEMGPEKFTFLPSCRYTLWCYDSMRVFWKLNILFCIHLKEMFTRESFPLRMYFKICHKKIPSFISWRLQVQLLPCIMIFNCN